MLQQVLNPGLALIAGEKNRHWNCLLWHPIRQCKLNHIEASKDDLETKFIGRSEGSRLDGAQLNNKRASVFLLRINQLEQSQPQDKADLLTAYFLLKMKVCDPGMKGLLPQTKYNFNIY